MIFTVPEKHCALIMRFDQFARVAEPGLNMRIPFVETLHRVVKWDDRANAQGVFIELTEQQSDTAPRQCQTKDNVTVEANASVYWRIEDPVKAAFEVDSLPVVMEDVTLNSLRSNVGMMELDEVLGSRDTLNQRVAHDLKEATRSWGVSVRRAEIQELRVDEHTRRAMTQQMEAERRRRARIAESEGEAQASINVAEAEKTASIRLAEGQAQAMRHLAEAETDYLRQLREVVGPEAAARLLLAEKYIQGFKTISRNEAHKVFLPNGVQAMLAVEGDGVAGRGRRGSTG